MKRIWVSIAIALNFVVLSATGLLLFFGIHSYLVESIHVFSSVFFFVLALVHISNNFKSLKKYIIHKK